VTWNRMLQAPILDQLSLFAGRCRATEHERVVRAAVNPLVQFIQSTWCCRPPRCRNG
jgi:hypothetical protein